MRRLLLFLCLLLPLLAQAAAPNRLVKIVVVGSERYADADLVRATGLRLNTQVTLDDLQNAASRIGSCGVFSSVQFVFKPAGGANGVEADFTVKDAEHFLPAVFENFVWLTDQDLQSALHDALPLYNGMVPASGSMADDVAAALNKILSAKGLPSDVSYSPTAEIGKPPASYNYKVNNAGLKIGPVNFVGAGHLEPALLAQSVASLKGRDYLRGDVDVVLKKDLLPLYWERGYLRTTFGEVKPRLSNGLVEIDVAVSEGDQYRLAGYSWSGNTLVSSEELSKRITVKPGELANAVKLGHDLNAARRLFGKVGHEGAAISQVPTFNGETVTYRFEVKEGELYHMGRVEISGVSTEASQKLLGLWKMPEGTPYDNTYPLQFTMVLRQSSPTGGPPRGQWEVHEHIDDARKVVDVVFQLR
jgi:outer membrane protein assembly factor BamA